MKILRLDKFDHFTYEVANDRYMRIVGIYLPGVRAPEAPQRFLAGLIYTQNHRAAERICNDFNTAITYGKLGNAGMEALRRRGKNA